MSLRDEHAAMTRQVVLESARRLFAANGYRKTSIDQIAKAGRVTKGAVYHHFKDKTAVFREVYEQLATELEGHLRVIADTHQPADALPAAIDLLLEGAADEEIRTILFREGPAVLGGECREIDRRHFLGLLQETLEQMKSDGLLKPVDTAVLAPLLLATLIEGSILLGHAGDVDATRSALRTALATLLAGVRTGG